MAKVQYRLAINNPDEAGEAKIAATRVAMYNPTNKTIPIIAKI